MATPENSLGFCSQPILNTVHQPVNYLLFSVMPVIYSVPDDSLRSNPQSEKLQLSQEEKKRIECPICSKTYSNKFVLHTHVMRCHEGQSHLCEVCNRKFNSKCDLVRHRNTHVNGSHKCDFCGVTFSVLRDLASHLKVHAVEGQFKCDKCEWTCIDSDKLSEHMETFHCENSKKYKCKICEKLISRRSGLQQHYKLIHFKQHIVACNICKKKFRYKSSLRSHMYVHTGKHNFICEICGKGLLTKGDLTRHTLSHGDHKVSCEICGKEFRYKVVLRAHLIREHGQKTSHVCDICDTGFISKSALDDHVRYHTGERPFKCDICERAFISVAHFGKHLACHENWI